MLKLLNGAAKFGEIELVVAANQKWRIDWEDIATRKWGRQRWPARLEFESIENLAETLNRTNELRLFRAALQEARERCPPLEPWLRDRAHHIVDYLEDWSGLLAVCAYFVTHPRPCCYPRQIPLPAGTKFIEERSGILREMLDVVVGDYVDVSAPTFAGRFHLLLEPVTSPTWRVFNFALMIFKSRCPLAIRLFATLNGRTPHLNESAKLSPSESK